VASPFHGTITSVPGIAAGHAEVEGGGSGCTVILGPFRGVVEVRGLATGTRELGTLDPTHLVSTADAILLTGGSAFGLAAADGVVAWLEERGRGFDTGVAWVPIVPAAVIFDLAPERGRPGPREGYAACEAALGGSAGGSEAGFASAPLPTGRVGAGAGATAGKLAGVEFAASGGLGSACRSVGAWTVGALSVVNPVGAVHSLDGRVVAGPSRPGGEAVDGEADLLAEVEAALNAGEGGGEGEDRSGPFPGSNTTLSVLATDAPLSKADLARVARVASTAFARTVSPVHTPFDGDVLFALSTGSLEREPGPMEPRALMALGVAGRTVVEQSILGAVQE
jgi:L-aminopeptidase/D-esterase-like protein